MPSPLMYHTHRRSRSSSRRVSFTEFVEVNEYRPLHPELKSALYYSREEMHEIRRRAKAVIAMRRQRQLVDWKMRNIQISPAYARYCSSAREQSGDRKWKATTAQFQQSSQDPRRDAQPSETYSAVVG
mmetsp:Transcript_5868/g.9751  ORF Transcript_5868/g.9751 Transcript_5868/m.9751 type:complete len:128 (+) Transcript_5868:158-541(+)